MCILFKYGSYCGCDFFQFEKLSLKYSSQRPEWVFRLQRCWQFSGSWGWKITSHILILNQLLNYWGSALWEKNWVLRDEVHSNFLQFTCMLSHFSHVQLFETQWIVAHQIPLSMGFSGQEYWSGSPFPSPGIFPTQRSNPEPRFCIGKQALYH